MTRHFRYDSWQNFCDDLAIALPQVPRPGETNFDSAHFNVLRGLPLFFCFADIELWETVGIGHWQKKEPGETQMVRSATVTAISAMTMAEIEGVSLRQASASLQARFSNAFLSLMVNRLRNVDEWFIASVGLHV